MNSSSDVTKTVQSVADFEKSSPPVPVISSLPDNKNSTIAVPTGKLDAPVISISIVSSSCLLREGLINLLFQANNNLRLAGTYSEHLPAFYNIPNPPAQVVLIDLNIGLEAFAAWSRYLRGQSSATQVIALEVANDVETILSCIRSGAAGYILRGDPVSRVMETIRQVQEGRTSCSPEITAQLFAEVATNFASQPEPAPTVNLLMTEREKEVLPLIVEGYSNLEIADALMISIHTVKRHVHNILEKLNLQHRFEVARLIGSPRWPK